MKENGKVKTTTTEETTEQKISRLNDELRQGQGVNGEIMLTSGIYGGGRKGGCRIRCILRGH